MLQHWPLPRAPATRRITRHWGSERSVGRVAGATITGSCAASFLVSASRSANMVNRTACHSSIARPAGVADAVALDPDRSAAHPQGLALRCGEPLADQVGQHVDGEAIGEKPRFGVAAWTAGEEL